MKTTTRLTEKQQAFAAEHHDLVDSFLRQKGLNGDFYDVVIFRYLHAVQIYDERPELRKYSFRTIAFNNMRSALSNHYKKQQRMMRDAAVLSLDAVDQDGLPLSEAVTGGAHVYEYAEIRDEWDRVNASLTPKQRETLALHVQGYSRREIAKVFRLAPDSVSGRMYRLRKKAEQIAA